MGRWVGGYREAGGWVRRPSRQVGSGQVGCLAALPLRVERGEEVGGPLGYVLIEGERECGEDGDHSPASNVHGVEVGDAAEAGEDVEEQLHR